MASVSTVYYHGGDLQDIKYILQKFYLFLKEETTSQMNKLTTLLSNYLKIHTSMISYSSSMFEITQYHVI